MSTEKWLTAARFQRCLTGSAYRSSCTAMAIALLICIQACTDDTPQVDTESDSFKRSVATQKRLNRYFHDQVVPKLEDCWGRIQGKGTIEVKYTFVKDEKGGWVFERLEGGSSSLPEGQDHVALACMQEAVTATSFSYEEEDSKAESFVVYWNWPVPLPANIEQQADAMFRSVGGVGGGCDGKGAAARCYTCGEQVECLTVCVGYDTCSINHGGGFKWCSEGTKACASGGPFGLGGGVIMY